MKPQAGALTGGAGAGAHSGRPEPNVRSSESQASVLFGGPSPASTPRDHGQASTPGARTQRHSAKLQLGAPLKPEFSAAPRSHRRALSPGRRRSACRPRHLSRAPPPRVPGQRYSATPQAGSVIEKHAPAPFRGIAAGRRHRGAWAGATPRGRSRAPSPRGPRPCPIRRSPDTHPPRGIHVGVHPGPSGQPHTEMPAPTSHAPGVGVQLAAPRRAANPGRNGNWRPGPQKTWTRPPIGTVGDTGIEPVTSSV
jgi:hypothetical protein